MSLPFVFRLLGEGGLLDIFTNGNNFPIVPATANVFVLNYIYKLFHRILMTCVWDIYSLTETFKVCTIIRIGNGLVLQLVL